MIDTHSHIIYGIDDGAKTIEDSMVMLRYAHKDGIKAMIATSHYLSDTYDYDVEHMEMLFEEIVNKIEEEQLPIKIYLGHEAYLNECLVKALVSGQCKTLNGSRYVLIDVFSNTPLHLMKKMLFDIQLEGFVPIIAHCERLIIIRNDCKKITEIKDMGCLMQVNASTLFKKNKLWFRRWLIRRIKDHTISIISSDAHNNVTRKPELRTAYNYVKKKAGLTIANNLFFLNPQKIVSDEPLI